MEHRISLSRGPKNHDQQQLPPLSNRRSSLLISTTSSSKKRWSITSTSSIHSTSSSNSSNSISSVAKRASITTIRGSPLRFGSTKSSDIADSDIGSDRRLGAQSAPALLSSRVQFSRKPTLLSSSSQQNPMLLRSESCTRSMESNDTNAMIDHQEDKVSKSSTNQPIVQLKKSSESSPSSSNQNSSDESNRARDTSSQNLNKSNNNDTNYYSNNNTQSDNSDDHGEEISKTSRTSRITKRRTIRTRQTKSSQNSSRVQSSLICKQEQQQQKGLAEEHQIINSADIEQVAKEKQSAFLRQQQQSHDSVDGNNNHNNNGLEEDNNNKSNTVNSFFRTRQIGGYQTSSSKTSIKTTSSKKSSSTITKKTHQQGDNQVSASNTLSSTSLSKSASKRHIATATLEQSQAIKSDPLYHIKSSLKDDEADEIGEAQAEAVISSPRKMSTTSSMMNPIDIQKKLTKTTINRSPDLSTSSFPFEIERVPTEYANPDGSQSAGSQQIEAAESVVSHRESFSTSTSSSLRGATFQGMASPGSVGHAHANQYQHQAGQQIGTTSTTSSCSSLAQLLTSRNSLTSTSSSIGSTIKAAADHRLSASSSSTTSSTRASQINQPFQPNASHASGQTTRSMFAASETSQHQQQHHQELSSRFQLSSSSGSMTKASSMANSSAANAFQILVSSPDVKSLAQEIGTDFAKLESCLTRAELANHHNHHLITSSNLFGQHQRKQPLTSRLFSHSIYPRTHHAFFNRPGDNELYDTTTNGAISPPKALPAPPKYSTSSFDEELGDDKQAILSSSNESNRSNRIRELLNKANHQQHSSTSSPSTLIPTHVQLKLKSTDHNNVISDNQIQAQGQQQHQQRSSAAMNESIERIEQKLSDICKKLDDCQYLKQAIELLEVLIQMIEKAWSVPVCGDDLGFRLCTTLRISGGLDFILSLIMDAHNSAGGKLSGFLSDKQHLNSLQVKHNNTTNSSDNDSLENNNNSSQNNSKNYTETGQAIKQNANNRNQLRLSMPNETSNEMSLPPPATLLKSNLIDHSDSNLNSPTLSAPRTPPVGTRHSNHPDTHSIHNNNINYQAKDSDSEILTSDLGLDSASVESFSYANPNNTNTDNINSNNNGNTNNNNNINSEQDDIDSEEVTRHTEEENEKKSHDREYLGAQNEQTTTKQQNNGDNSCNLSLQKDELIFLSARLLSQCLTTDNRDYLVQDGWLEPIVKLACRLAMIKSGQAHRKLLLGSSRCLLTRQSSTVCSAQLKSLMKNISKPAKNESKTEVSNTNQLTAQQPIDNIDNNAEINPKPTNEELPKEEDQQADLLAAIGTEILQHLFKHSEDTCTTIISMGGLEAILFGCRSSCVDTLRHCAPALANLALHGGPQAHESMIEQKVHVWLFPLAFNEDDNVQYYACLAIVTLVANQEIEADVLKSSTLNLVEPFVTSHEPRRFAESNTAHIHGQSANWLRRLIPLLSSKREEARNLAAFHLAMEAYVKREQSQSHIFKEIGAIEPLKKLGGSPNAIASKFACQALRLIGEQVPHRLSQQVALWTTEDVIQWVCQVGFENYESQFHDSGVDGDLLLQLDESMLERDIGIKNGITRRRFLRELSQLKCISDYSSLDRTGLCQMLGTENLQYAYTMLKFGVTRDNICHLDADHLLEECGIPNTIHRKILSQTIRSLQDKMALQAQAAADLAQNGSDSANQKTLDVFVSYRRSTGSQLASLLKVHLQLRNFSVFIDVERLEAGKFDNNLLDSIKQARNFILVLSPNALDRCIDDFECKDWVHKEIVAALASDCNIIPIMDNFSFPDPEKLPEDMRSILYYNGVPWIHDYQDACVDKIERFIRGEVNKVNGLAGFNILPSTNVAMTNSSQQSNCGSLKRHLNQFASSTPSIGGPITPIMNQHQQHQQQQYNDYAHPLASAINYHQQGGQNLFYQQQANISNGNNNINNNNVIKR